MPNTGEKAGIGLFICANCGEHVYVQNKDQALPLCPNCQETLFFKA